MKFFIPGLDEETAEARWSHYVANSQFGASLSARRTFRLVHQHDGSELTVEVGKPRSERRRETGPRGGYIKNAPLERFGRDTGTVVSGIVDAGAVFEVWSFGPPFGGWANPSFVGKSEVSSVEHFDEVLP